MEPLSEADKSEPQLVRDKSFPSILNICEAINGTWHFKSGALVPGAGSAYQAFEFLCLTPVTPEDK